MSPLRLKSWSRQASVVSRRLVGRTRAVPRWAVVGVCLGAVAACAMAACTTESQTRAAIARSSDPVMLPPEPWLSQTTFTTYKGWTDQYEFRYNQKLGDPSNFRAIQFSEASVSAVGRESPSQQEVDRARHAAFDSTCPIVDEPSQLRLCVTELQSYLVRTFDVDSRSITLVANYFDNPAAANGDASANAAVYNPGSIEAQVMTSAFAAVPVAEAAAAKLEVIT